MLRNSFTAASRLLSPFTPNINSLNFNELGAFKWYQLKKPEIFESLKKLKKILNDNEIEFINASNNTSEKILQKMKLEEFS